MRTFPRSLAVLGLALGLGAVAAPAFAAQPPVLDEQQRSTLQAQVDAFESCLQSQGVTRPEKPADGTRPQLTEEQRGAMRAAFEACASQRPQRPELTEEQRTTLRAQMEEHRACMETQLSAAGITRPERPADGTRPVRPELTEAQKAAFAAARDACADSAPNLGVEGLGRPHGPGGPGGPGRGEGRGHGGPRPGAPADATSTRAIV